MVRCKSIEAIAASSLFCTPLIEESNSPSLPLRLTG